MPHYAKLKKGPHLAALKLPEKNRKASVRHARGHCPNSAWLYSALQVPTIAYLQAELKGHRLMHVQYSSAT